MIYINGRFLTQQLTGVQRFAFEMVKGLMKISSFDFCILLPPKEIHNSFEKASWPTKVIGKNFGTLWEQIDLPLFLIANGCPLLINLVNTAPGLYERQIVSILDMTTFINATWFNYKFVFWYKIIVPAIAKRSLQIITISENSKYDIIKFLNINPAKMNVLYCGLTEKFLNKKPESIFKSNLLSKLCLEHENYILAVSSLDPRKNFKRLIEAYLSTRLTVTLVIVGSKGKVFADDGIKNLVNTSSNIKFTGYVSDEELIELYTSANCFVYPSLYEGFGMPPIEAMACGCATIVSNTSSLPEVCGDASLYVDPLNIKEISTAILKLINDSELRKDLIQKGFTQIKKYSWEKSAQRLLEMIEKNI